MGDGQPSKSDFLLAARLKHIAEAFSEVHWGPQSGSAWQGTMEAGELCFDNGCGDVLAAAWDARGLVGLAFDHELERTPLTLANSGAEGFFAAIPGALRSLVEAASQWAGGEFTNAFWALGDGELQGEWRNALEHVLPSTDLSLGSETLEQWVRQHSLDKTHIGLALRLAKGPWGVALNARDTQLIVSPPAEAEHPPERIEAMEQAAEMLRAVGLHWSAPLDLAEAHRRAHADRRRQIAIEALGEADAALFESVRAGDLAAVEELLAAGANVEAETLEDQFQWTPAGDTPLLQAIKHGHEHVAACLLAAGADVGHANCYKQTALYWAVRNRLQRTFDTLRSRGADCGRPDSRGWTPLHHAAAGGFDDMVERLLREGVDKEARNANGHRAIDVARLREQASVIRLLGG